MRLCAAAGHKRNETNETPLSGIARQLQGIHVQMARICACCEHPQRTAIEAQLVSGRSLRTVAADFGLRPAALHRHSQNHLSASLRATAQAHQTAAQPQGTQSAKPFRPTELQPVATEEAQHSTSPANSRALQLEDASGNCASPPRIPHRNLRAQHRQTR